MDVFQGLAERCWHLLVQVLVMTFVLSGTIRDELICACLFDVVIEPWEVKLIHAEAHQVQERLDVINWCRIWM